MNEVIRLRAGIVACRQSGKCNCTTVPESAAADADISQALAAIQLIVNTPGTVLPGASTEVFDASWVKHLLTAHVLKVLQ